MEKLSILIVMATLCLDFTGLDQRKARVKGEKEEVLYKWESKLRKSIVNQDKLNNERE